MKCCVVNLGCKVNRVESDDVERAFGSAGCCFTSENDADVIVVNTCTVTGEAEKKTRKAVRHALRANGRARVVVTGCAVAIDAATYRAMGERVEIVLKPDLSDYVASLIESECATDRVVESRFDVAAGLAPAAGPRGRTRAGVKVQDGCDNACTYCIVHVARGRAVSRPLDQVKAETSALARAGVREIVLSGINIGSYNWHGAGVADLIEELLAVIDLPSRDGFPAARLRVSSIEPADVSDDFVRLLAKAQGRVCRHLHLPLQSGSSKVLREMARPYDAEEFAQLVDYLRVSVPGLSLSTDVIVGFPGETDEDFADTCAVARESAFSKIHVFPYSMRAGTPAAERGDQITPEVKTQRAAALRALSDDLRETDWRGRVGAVELALVEERGRAMTESYYSVLTPQGAEVGSLVPVELDRRLD